MTKTNINRTGRVSQELALRRLELRVIAAARRSYNFIVRNTGCCDLHEDEMRLVCSVEALDEATGKTQ